MQGKPERRKGNDLMDTSMGTFHMLPALVFTKARIGQLCDPADALERPMLSKGHEASSEPFCVSTLRGPGSFQVRKQTG